jgi:hypothetical protein
LIQSLVFDEKRRRGSRNESRAETAAGVTRMAVKEERERRRCDVQHAITGALHRLERYVRASVMRGKREKSRLFAHEPFVTRLWLHQTVLHEGVMGM